MALSFFLSNKFFIFQTHLLDSFKSNDSFFIPVILYFFLFYFLIVYLNFTPILINKTFCSMKGKKQCVNTETKWMTLTLMHLKWGH